LIPQINEPKLSVLQKPFLLNRFAR